MWLNSIISALPGALISGAVRGCLKSIRIN
jgi:hypothetical protein